MGAPSLAFEMTDKKPAAANGRTGRPRTVNIARRLYIGADEELVARIEQFRLDSEAKLPGARFDMPTVMRMLITRALDAHDKENTTPQRDLPLEATTKKS